MEYIGDLIRIKSAKKNHRCSWCNEEIETGTPYARWINKDGGCFVVTKIHPECEAALDEARDDYIDGFSAGENPRGCNCGFTAGCERCQKRGEV